jgi:hypothetical protein
VRRRRLAALLAGTALVAVLASACNIPVEQWVPDFDGDGTISQTEVDRQTEVVAQAVAQAVEQQRRAVQQHPVLACIRRHESDRAGGYNAQNQSSSASGAYQFIDSTWRTAAARAGHPGYSRAKYAPWYIQDAVALYTINHGGRSHWRGSGC